MSSPSEKLALICTESCRKGDISSFIKRSFDRMACFWSGQENAPEVIWQLLPVLRDVEIFRQKNFPNDLHIYVQAKFFLDDENCVVTFYPYPENGVYPNFTAGQVAWEGTFTK